MSGHDIPYQLRTNKFVERQLFLDILDAVRIWNGPRKYLYASMGGRFLEDFKIVNDRFAIEKMISIEGDETTNIRQKYNRLGFIDCQKAKSGEFVDDLDRIIDKHPDERFIVWLDFTEPKKRGKQLGEFQQLVSKLASGDVAKITLNANYKAFRSLAEPLTKRDFDNYLRDPESPTHVDFETYVKNELGMLAETDDDEREHSTDRVLQLSEKEYESILIKNLVDQLDTYVPFGGIKPETLSNEEFPRFLANVVRVAAQKGVEKAGLNAVPLGVFKYKDGQQMLTVTVVIATDKLRQTIESDKVFGEWPFRAKDWHSVIDVNVPDLSSKERHFINGLISDELASDLIHQQLPFRFDKNEAKSLIVLKAYIDHYRRYPTFGRVQD